MLCGWTRQALREAALLSLCLAEAALSKLYSTKMKRLRKSAPRSMLVLTAASVALLLCSTQTASADGTRKRETPNRQRRTEGDKGGSPTIWWHMLLPTYSPVVAPTIEQTPAPITASPVTAAPITASPVTAAPITASPVTAAPTTASPVTAAPITASPVTAAPITASPVAAPPTTPSPTTTAPSITDSPVSAPSIPSAPRNSTTAYESSETLYSQDSNSTTGEGTDLIYLASCGLSTDLNETASPVSNQIVAFDYEITLANNDTGEEPSPEVLNAMEARLNAYLAGSYLGDCTFTDSQFQTMAMSSLPLDTVGSRCTDGTSNCYTIHAALTAQIFYWTRRRDLQKTENFISDTVLLQSFGGSLTEAFASDALLLGNDDNITSLQFVRITNFAEGTQTFGGVDPTDSSGATGVVEEKSPSVGTKAGKAGAATFLAFALVALVAVAVVTIRKRRRGTKRNEELERTAALDDDRLFTFDDEDTSGKEPRVVSPPASNVSVGDDEELTTEEEDEGRTNRDAFVVLDHMTDNGDDDMSQFTGIEVESLFGRRNKNPPIFVRADGKDESYDPYNHDKTPDTLDL